MTKVMEMMNNQVGRYEIDTNPLINKMPQTAKVVTPQNEVNCRLRAATTSNTTVVLLVKNHPANQIVFCWQFVSKESSNEH